MPLGLQRICCQVLKSSGGRVLRKSCERHLFSPRLGRRSQPVDRVVSYESQLKSASESSGGERFHPSPRYFTLRLCKTRPAAAFRARALTKSEPRGLIGCQKSKKE